MNFANQTERLDNQSSRYTYFSEKNAAVIQLHAGHLCGCSENIFSGILSNIFEWRYKISILYQAAITFLVMW